MTELIEIVYSDDYRINCEHCNKLLKNVAFIKQDDDIKKVGVDCLKKIVGMDLNIFFNEYSDFKKILARHKKNQILKIELTENKIHISTINGFGFFNANAFLIKSLQNLNYLKGV